MNISKDLILNITATVIGGLILAIILPEKKHWKGFLSDLKLSIVISLSLLSNEIKTILLSESFISVFNPISKIIMAWTVRLSHVICGAVVVMGLLLQANPYCTVILGVSIVIAVEVPYRMLMTDLKVAAQ